jgi:hypothetical protein
MNPEKYPDLVATPKTEIRLSQLTRKKNEMGTLLKLYQYFSKYVIVDT